MDNDDKKKSFHPIYMYTPRETWGISLALGVVLVIIFIIVATSGPPIMGHLRGGRRLIVWPPDPGDPPKAQLSVYGAGNVYVSGTPERVSTQESHTIEALITHWCQSTPSFRPLAEDEPFYDVALECGDRRKRFKVPVEQCPPVLSTFFE